MRLRQICNDNYHHCGISGSVRVFIPALPCGVGSHEKSYRLPKRNSAKFRDFHQSAGSILPKMAGRAFRGEAMARRAFPGWRDQPHFVEAAPRKFSRVFGKARQVAEIVPPSIIRKFELE
jgi:hypothetical protein